MGTYHRPRIAIQLIDVVVGCLLECVSPGPTRGYVANCTAMSAAMDASHEKLARGRGRQSLGKCCCFTHVPIPHVHSQR